MAVNSDLELAIAIAKAKEKAREQQNPLLDLTPTPPMKTEGVVAQLNAGIAESLGSPVDAVNSGLGRAGLGSDKPFLGSKSIGGMMRGVGIPSASGAPLTRAEVAAKGTGAAVGFVPVLMTGSAAANAVAELQAGGKAELAARSLTSATAPFYATPAKAMLSEALAGGGAAVAQDISTTRGYGTLGDVLAPVVGGALAGIAPAALSAGMRGAGRASLAAAKLAPGIGVPVRLAAKGLAGGVAPFTKAGATAIAEKRVRTLSADTAGQANSLLPPENVPAAQAAAMESMTPAQRTGDVRLMALERAVLKTDAALSDKFRERTAKTTELLRQAFTGDSGNVGDTIGYLRGRRDYYVGLLEQRTQQALDRAEQRLSKASPNMDQMAASRVVKSELEKARTAARTMESQLWAKVPNDAVVGTSNLNDAWAKIMAETPEAIRGRIPKIAKTMLGRRGGMNGSVKEINGLYSELGAIIRHEAARPGGEQTVRFAKELQQAALRDLGTVDPTTPVGRLVNTAREFSLDLNKTFTQGTVGRILGVEDTGGAIINDALTLDKSLGQGRVSAVALDQIQKAAGNNATPAIGKYILGQFNDFAAPDGILNPKRADMFFRKNKDLLDRMPDVAIRLVGARDAAYAAERSAANTARISKASASPRESAVAAFTSAPKGRQMDTIFAADNPIVAAKAVYQQAAKDPTGAALDGLKRSLSEYLVNNAVTGSLDSAGNPIQSGKRLQALMRDNDVARVMNKVFTKAERQRAQNIANLMANVELSTGSLPDIGGKVITDGPSRVITYIARVMAAKGGAKFGAGSSGSSLQAAGMASSRMQRFMNSMTEGRSAKLVADAIQDPDLLRALMIDYAKAPAKDISFSEKYLNSWLTGIIASESANTDRQVN